MAISYLTKSRRSFIFSLQYFLSVICVIMKTSEHAKYNGSHKFNDSLCQYYFKCHFYFWRLWHCTVWVCAEQLLRHLLHVIIELAVLYLFLQTKIIPSVHARFIKEKQTAFKRFLEVRTPITLRSMSVLGNWIHILSSFMGILELMQRQPIP